GGDGSATPRPATRDELERPVAPTLGALQFPFMDRRHFVSALTGAALTPAALPGFVPDAIRRLSDSLGVAQARGVPRPPNIGTSDAHAVDLARDEDFWEP